MPTDPVPWVGVVLIVLAALMLVEAVRAILGAQVAADGVQAGAGVVINCQSCPITWIALRPLNAPGWAWNFGRPSTDTTSGRVDVLLGGDDVAHAQADQVGGRDVASRPARRPPRPRASSSWLLIRCDVLRRGRLACRS